MKVVRFIRDIPKPWPHEVGFVPTMGALHVGHTTLMQKAKQDCGFAAASIFVNPTQFGPNEDYAKYPRNEATDFEKAEAAGVDLMFAPSVEEMYPKSVTSIHVGGVTEEYEGAYRPGHFDGVATVVAKLFNAVGPSHAYFGWKDFQQCVVIQRMVSDLNFPVALKFQETVREPDGLAMSSRNAYLTASQRVVAPSIYANIVQLREEILAGEDVAQKIMIRRQSLEDNGIVVQYLDYVDESTLTSSLSRVQMGRIIVAGLLGKTRLIDNISV